MMLESIQVIFDGAAAAFEVFNKPVDALPAGMQVCSALEVTSDLAGVLIEPSVTFAQKGQERLLADEHRTLGLEVEV
jgi:hypothetical protein